jgi:hypothetical protein
MKSHQPEVFETTLQKTNTWLKEISDLLHWDDHHKTYHGLRAVLHALRDHHALKDQDRTGLLRRSEEKFRRGSERQPDAPDRRGDESVRTLASKIQRQFQIGDVGHYAAYEDELQRIWPLDLENRRAKIEQFAKEYGLNLGFYKQGLCAIFVKNPPSLGAVTG